MNRNVASFMSVNHLKEIMTEKGKMKISQEEFDDLIRRTPLVTQIAGVVNYKDIIELFTKDFERVNIIRKLYKIIKRILNFSINKLMILNKPSLQYREDRSYR